MRALLAASTIALGCGGTTEHEPPGGNGGSSAAAGAGNGGIGAGSSGAAGTATVESLLMPFADGRSWTFQIEALDGLEPEVCPNPTSMVSGTGDTPEGPGWHYFPACVREIFLMAQDGDNVTAYGQSTPAPPPIEYMREPVEEGATWSMYAWREAGQVTVPAGTFDDCWRREWVEDAREYVTFCRGIGLVYLETPNRNQRVELAAKNF